MEFDEPQDDDEKSALEEFQRLVEADLAEATDSGFVLQLIMPVWADPKLGKGMQVTKLVFGHLTIGQLIDSEKKSGNAEQQLKLISDLTGVAVPVLRQLNPKDFKHAGVVARIPLFGPRYLPTGRSG